MNNSMAQQHESKRDATRPQGEITSAMKAIQSRLEALEAQAKLLADDLAPVVGAARAVPEGEGNVRQVHASQLGAALGLVVDRLERLHHDISDLRDRMQL